MNPCGNTCRGRRQRPDGTPGVDGWYPEQRLTLEETIRAFSLAAAETSGQANKLGSLAVGKLADMTIVDQDPGRASGKGAARSNSRRDNGGW
ncbi:MAG: amidohydrolase family protein [Chloroflexota bacterium]